MLTSTCRAVGADGGSGGGRPERSPSCVYEVCSEALLSLRVLILM